MPEINRDDYSAEEIARYDAAYSRLQKIIAAKEPGSGELRHALAAELAAGLPIDWPDGDGWTLLHWAVNMSETLDAGLPQILIGAGADLEAVTLEGNTPLDVVAMSYVNYTGKRDETTALIFAAAVLLLKAGARPAANGGWRSLIEDGEGERARREEFDGFIAAQSERAAFERVVESAPGFDYSL